MTMQSNRQIRKPQGIVGLGMEDQIGQFIGQIPSVSILTAERDRDQVSSPRMIELVKTGLAP